MGQGVAARLGWYIWLATGVHSGKIKQIIGVKRNMDLSFIFTWLAQYQLVHNILIALGALVVLGQAYVAITPSQSDDAWFAKLESIPLVGYILKGILSFAPIQRKDLPVVEIKVEK
jgi:hypothetical protein